MRITSAFPRHFLINLVPPRQHTAPPETAGLDFHCGHSHRLPSLLPQDCSGSEVPHQDCVTSYSGEAACSAAEDHVSCCCQEQPQRSWAWERNCCQGSTAPGGWRVGAPVPAWGSKQPRTRRAPTPSTPGLSAGTEARNWQDVLPSLGQECSQSAWRLEEDCCQAAEFR